MTFCVFLSTVSAHTVTGRKIRSGHNLQSGHSMGQSFPRSFFLSYNKFLGFHDNCRQIIKADLHFSIFSRLSSGSIKLYKSRMSFAVAFSEVNSEYFPMIFNMVAASAFTSNSSLPIIRDGLPSSSSFSVIFTFSPLFFSLYSGCYSRLAIADCIKL